MHKYHEHWCSIDLSLFYWAPGWQRILIENVAYHWWCPFHRRRWHVWDADQQPAIIVHWVKEIQYSYRLHPMCTSPHLDVLFWNVVSTIWHISNAILVYSCDIFVSKWLWFFIIDTPSWVHTLPTDPAERTHRDQGQLSHCPTRLAGKGSYLVDQRCWQPRMVEA